jgi:hypothetical protein
MLSKWVYSQQIYKSGEYVNPVTVYEQLIRHLQDDFPIIHERFTYQMCHDYVCSNHHLYSHRIQRYASMVPLLLTATVHRFDYAID